MRDKHRFPARQEARKLLGYSFFLNRPSGGFRRASLMTFTFT